MTLFGAHVVARDLAVCWADSEIYDHRYRIVGRSNKLVANPAGFAFVMTGWSSVASRAGCVVANAPDLATALRRLPGVLRRASEQAASASYYPHLYAGQHAALIGFDPKCERMTAWRFLAAECFVAIEDDRQTVPMPAAGQVMPDGPHQVMAIAERQLARIRKGVPDAVGGPLHVAVIRPDGITCNRLCDLAETVQTSPVSESLEEPTLVH